MATVIFVHGISIRYPALAEMLGLCETQIKKCFPNSQLRFVAWGNQLGTPHWPTLKSIPDYSKRSGKQDVGDAENESALWSLLYRDPLFELRLLNSQQAEASRGPSFGQASPGEQLAEAVSNLAVDEATKQFLTTAGLMPHFENARATVVGSSDFSQTRQTATEPLARYRQALARAILAKCVIEALDRALPVFCIQAQLRSDLAEAIVNQLGGLQGAMPPWLMKPFLGVALDHISKNFGKLSHDYYQLVGDILVYQSRGKQIRNAIRTELEQAEPPILLIGHSLGGIACFETLYELATASQISTLGKVKHLVTVGSQVPFFYECNALSAVACTDHDRQEVLPQNYPKWTNVYDTSDFLSFVAEPLFQGVRDVLLKSGQPFPVSHSAYFGQETLWQILKQST